MFKKIFLIIILLLLFAAVTATAIVQEDSPNVILTFVDALSQEPLDDVFVQVELNEDIFNYHLGSDESLKLNLEEGDYHFKFLVNKPETESYDYYGETYFEVKGSLIKVIYLYPVGSVNGFIKDSLENVINGADLKFDCNEVFNVDYPEKTDKFGSFDLKYIPVGNCQIFGSFSDSVGVVDVEVKQGEKVPVNIVLDQVLVSLDNNHDVFFIVLALITIMVIFIFWKKYNSLEKKEKVEEEEIKILEKDVQKIEEKSELGQRGKDIYHTLRDNEKKIIDFLLVQKQPIHLSKIHYKTGISKGSLFRNLESLEHKQIIETIREGKVRKAKLSSWFLER